MTKQQKNLKICDLERVIESMTDKETVEKIKHRFYIESIMGTIAQIYRVYPKEIAEDRAVAFVMELVDKGLISITEFLDITLDTLLKEGEEHEN